MESDEMKFSDEAFCLLAKYAEATGQVRPAESNLLSNQLTLWQELGSSSSFKGDWIKVQKCLGKIGQGEKDSWIEAKQERKPSAEAASYSCDSSERKWNGKEGQKDRGRKVGRES